MANPTNPPVPTSISGLGVSPNSLTGGEYIPIVQNGVTYKATAAQFVVTIPNNGGGVNTSGSPMGGQLTQFSGPTTITNADLSGDITTSGTLATTIAANAVTNAKAAKMNALTVKCNNTNGSANASDLALSGSQILGCNAGGTALSGITLGTNLSMSGTTLNATTGAVVAYGIINGCLLSSLAGTATTATTTVGSGQATDSTNASYITSAGYSWAVSNGNAINGYQGGTTLPNSSTIHMYICTGGTGTGSFASTSLTPTAPAGYNTYYRRVGSFKTNGSGAPIAYTSIEAEGGSTINWLTTQTLDVNVANLGVSRVLYTLNCPSGIKMAPIIRYSAQANVSVILTSGDETDVAPTTFDTAAAPGYDFADLAYRVSGAFVTSFLTTNTSAQIGARSDTASSTFWVVSRGWKDFRRS